MAAKNSHVIIRQRHPLLQKGGYVLAGLAVLLGIWLAFDYGRARAGFDSGRAGDRQSLLQTKIDDLEDINEELRNQNAVLVQASQVDRKAYMDVEQSLKGLQDEILELKQEITFYQGIVSPNGSARGVRVQDFRLSKGGSSGAFHYEFVLMQVVSGSTQVKGVAEMTIVGLLHNQPHELRYADVIQGENRQLAFQFKFFQKLTGDMVLPDGFVPQQVKVRVIPEEKKLAPVEKSYDWNELIA
ncbi:MAG: hypothetical protein HY940_10305 [Gammaproteobacteria bacterium]|nr:hypothetical protein [Gammaproteobacteria bacterium]